MILAIDVGNSNIVVGCIDKKGIRFIERMSTDLNKTRAGIRDYSEENHGDL